MQLERSAIHAEQTQQHV